jgi:glycosyltransferase involved in cell wall biosynthesis
LDNEHPSEAAAKLRGRRILYIDSMLTRAGAENLRYFGCRALHAAGAVQVALVLGEPGEVATDLETQGLAEVIAPRCGDKPRSLKAFRAVHEAIARVRPEIIVAGRLNAAYFSVLNTGARWSPSGPKVVVEVMSTDDFMRFTAHVVWRGLLHSAHRVAACSRMVGDTVARRYGVPRERIAITTVGADLKNLARLDRKTARERLGITDDRPVVGSVGTLKSAKRYDRFLRGMRLFEERTGQRPWIVLSGRGPERSALEALAQELHLADRVIFCPRFENIGHQYSVLDVFVMSSDVEGLPLVIPEAMSMDVPVIATRVSGIPDVVQDCVNGRLYEKDDLDAMGVLIDEALRGGENVKKRVAAAHAFAFRHFTAESYAESVMQAYASLL